MSFTQKGGFTEQTFVLENASQHWFKNYEQHLTNVEGDQLDAIFASGRLALPFDGILLFGY